MQKLYVRSYDETKEENTYKEHFTDHYKIFSLAHPSEPDFCGEKVPLEREDVKESLDRELLVNTYWQSQTLLFIKRVNKWFPTIEKILEKNNVPDDFKYLALIESGLTNVTSPAGAKGFWQFMKGAGEEYGLTINSEVDERYHVEKATQAACDYLNEAYKKFDNNWTLAAASYNMGMAGLKKQLERQATDNYYDLVLGEETSRYVFRIVAIKEILGNYEDYGFNVRKEDLYILEPTTEISVDSTVTNWAMFAQNQGFNYKILKYHNPWLRDNKLSNEKGVEYKIKVPK
ncbi:MAG: lytic transglycosylase domain-containing protein [Flavobacteriales bacterium]|nr:lytic transglycosylase domain-containing protein [Flavobacteriales bacterium]